MANTIAEFLFDLGISTPSSLQPFWPRTRDREDVGVLKCRGSGVLLLSSTDHVTEATYRDNPGLSYWSAERLEDAWLATEEDDCRRADEVRDLARGACYLDFGCGAGGVMRQLRDDARRIVGVELQDDVREALASKAFEVYSSPSAFPADLRPDLVTMFHVLEHIPDPLEILGQLRERMAPGGTLLVEVPHAKDALIERYRCADFMDFTFWSEHVLLHTRESLRRTLERAGFEAKEVRGLQRYPLANHLHWLSVGKPGGHGAWKDLTLGSLDREYAVLLDRLDLTDTLWAVATAPVR